MNITQKKQTQIVYDYMKDSIIDLVDIDEPTADRLLEKANNFIHRHGFDIDPIHNGFYLIKKVKEAAE